jgi:hypothetical protein
VFENIDDPDILKVVAEERERALQVGDRHARVWRVTGNEKNERGAYIAGDVPVHVSRAPRAASTSVRS